MITPLRRLPEHDRRALCVVGGALLVLAIVLFLDRPLYSSARQLEHRSAEERQRLSAIVSMSRDYLIAKADMDDVRSTAFTTGSALGGLDAIVVRSGLKKKMSGVKNTTNPVADGIKAVRAELMFDKIPLTAVSGLIAMIESDAHPIGIERVALKASYEDPVLFSATVIVHTVERE